MRIESIGKKPLIMVTGASGFIGSFIRTYLNEDYDLICVDIQASHAPLKNENWKNLDVTKADDMELLFSSLDRPLSGLIHLAWYYDFSNQPHERYEAAVATLPKLVDLFSKSSYGKAPFIFASSMASLAPTTPGVKQTADSKRSEAWQYPASKVRGENKLRAMTIEQPIIELVLAGVYSDFCELVPLYQSIERIRNGSFQGLFFPGRTDRGLTYVHIDDAIDAIRLCLTIHFPNSSKIHRLLIGESTPVTNQLIFDEASKTFKRSKMPKMYIPPQLAKLGASMMTLIDPRSFIQPWMIPFAEEHFEFDLSQTTKTIGWTPQKSLAFELPKMLSLAQTQTDEWLLRNNRRPWRRDQDV